MRCHSLLLLLALLLSMLVAGTESWPALRPYEVRCSKEAKESFLELKLHFYIGECHVL